MSYIVVLPRRFMYVVIIYLTKYQTDVLID